ncbi:MAG: T9SS type A sorting domain-containing protein, partial [Bacteroidia bacterium]|nr:T9SS type A sorting domain-containing protein [Bacteroidia bacterium]
TLTVGTVPVCNITGNNIICSGSNSTLTASGGTSYLWSTGATSASVTISPTTNTTYTVTVTNASGCTSSCSQLVSVNAKPTCSLSVPATLPNCQSTGNILSTTLSANTSYLWTVTGNGWAITNGATTNSITYSAGNNNSTGTFKVVVTSTINGCKDSCTVSFGCNGNMHRLFSSAINCNTSNDGSAPSSSQFCYSIGNNGKVKSSVPNFMEYWLTFVAPTTDFCVEIVQSKQCTQLALLHLQQGQIRIFDLACNTLVSSGTETVYSSTQQVSRVCIAGATPGNTYIVAVKYNVNSINNTTPPPSGSCVYDFFARTVVGNTVATIPNSSDNITAQFGCAARTDGSLDGLLSIDVYPNPFSEYTNIEFTVEKDSHITVEIYNAIGQKVAALFNGFVIAGEKNKVLFDSEKFAQGMYVVKIAADDRDYYHKIILNR